MRRTTMVSLIVAAAMTVAGPAYAADDFADADVITTLPFAATEDTTSASDEPGEETPSCALGETSVWYRYTPSSDRAVSIETHGSDYDTVLAVYTGADLGSLTEIACNDDAQGTLQSALSVQATAATTYHVQITGFNGGTGILQLSVDETPLPPDATNDDFAAATVIDDIPYADEVYTAAATEEPGEEEPSCAPGDASVWYRHTPAADTSVRFHTTGSKYDTVLAVYTGPGLGGLTEIACGDDEIGRQSEVIVDLAAGTTYHVQVSAFFSGPGDVLRFAADPAPPAATNDAFSSRTLLNTLPFAETILTTETSTELLERRPTCAPIGRTVWYEYRATAGERIHISTAGSTFDTVVAAYVGLQPPALIELGCDDDGGPSQSSSLTVTAPGDLPIYIQVGGYAGSRGILTVTVDQA